MADKTTTTAKSQFIDSRICTEEDFINYPRFNNSLKKLMHRHPNGVKTEVICKALNMTEEEVEKAVSGALEKLKMMMKTGRYGKI